MNILILIGIIISLCFSLYSLYCSHKVTKILKQVEDNQPVKTKQEDPVEYMHSLDFNTFLDGQIQRLLGNYSNEEIVTKVYARVLKYKPIQGISRDELRKYITDVLCNYHNPYIESIGKISAIEDYFEPANQIDIKSIEKINTTNIDSVLNDFYR